MMRVQRSRCLSSTAAIAIGAAKQLVLLAGIVKCTEVLGGLREPQKVEGAPWIRSLRRRDLGEGFRQLFELIPALDDATLDQVFRIRHDVYCRDLGWEPVRKDGRESDEYDRHSFHCLLRRRGTGEPVGCTRLILARPEDPSYPLPFEDSCEAVLDRSIADPARMPRHTIGEVSRLAVLNTLPPAQG